MIDSTDPVSSVQQGMLRDTRLVAIAAMLAATLFYLLGDTVVKLTTDTVPVAQIITVRGAIAACLIAIAAFLTGVLRYARMMLTPRVLLRGSLDGATTLLFVNALANIPIADATAIINAVPIASTVLAIYMLREKVSAARWLAIIGGFLGVLLILRPEPGGFDHYGLLAVGAMMTLGFREIVTRRIGREIPSLIVTLGSAVMVTVAGGLASVVTGEWVTLGRTDGLSLGLAAVFLCGALHFSVVALRQGEVSLVGPFRYAILLWALLVGYLIWGDVPDWFVVTGMGLITISGLLVLRSEPGLIRSEKSGQPRGR